MWWCVGALAVTVIAIVGGAVVLALSTCQYDPTDTEEPEDDI